MKYTLTLSRIFYFCDVKHMSPHPRWSRQDNKGGQRREQPLPKLEWQLDGNLYKSVTVTVSVSRWYLLYSSKESARVRSQPHQALYPAYSTLVNNHFLWLCRSVLNFEDYLIDQCPCFLRLLSAVAGS